MKFYTGVPKHYAAVDCIIFGYDIYSKEIRLLIVRRSFDPSKGKWSLAGGFVMENESLDQAARRILFNLTGLRGVFMEQSYTFGKVKRDPGARVISTSYFALIKIQDISKQKKEVYETQWRPVADIPELIFDHREMVDRALAELQFKLKFTPVGFELLPEKFTLVQLQDLYEVLYRRAIDKRNFRKKILSMNLLEKLEEKEKKTSKKGAYYYRFIPGKYESSRKNGFYFDLDFS